MDPKDSLSPSPKDPPARRYLDFLRLTQLAKTATPELHLDASSERLLHRIAVAWHADSKITVLQAMNEEHGMSTTTAHRRLKSLRQQGFIALETDANDQRVKYVVPTEKTQRLFAQYGDCLTAAKG